MFFGVSSISEVRKLPAAEITEKLSNVKVPGKSAWFPKTDGYIFPDGVVSSIMRGTQHQIPYLIGCNEDETGSMPGFMSQATPQAVEGFARAIFPDDVKGYLRSVDLSSPDAIRQTVFDQYENDKLCAILGWQKIEMERKGNTAYTYFFTKDAPEAGDNHHGAYHGAELPLVFNTMSREGRPYTGAHFELACIMQEYFSNFFKTGDPTGPGLPVWTKPESSMYEFMELGDHAGMISVPTSENREFIVDYMTKIAKDLIV